MGWQQDFVKRATGVSPVLGGEHHRSHSGMARMAMAQRTCHGRLDRAGGERNRSHSGMARMAMARLCGAVREPPPIRTAASRTGARQIGGIFNVSPMIVGYAELALSTVTKKLGLITMPTT